MFYQVVLNESSAVNTTGEQYEKNYIYPFPLSGKYRVRITGYQLSISLSSGTATSLILNSRTMKNPLMPYLYYFSNVASTTSLFDRTGFWECELGTSIDFTIRLTDTAFDNISACTLVINFEVEPIK
jgi:hypothetical protein